MDASVIDVIKKVASDVDVSWEALAAVVKTESNGVVYANIGGRREPLILTEYHKFDKYLQPTERNIARKEGLSNPRWGAISYPKTQLARWELLEKWKFLDANAAFMSCSWGVGQVMGFHWKTLGYESVHDLVAEARSGLEGQLRLMLRFLTKNNLLDKLRQLDWSAFARGYNGSGYRKNKYHIKLAKAYAGFKGHVAGKPLSTGLPRLGSKGFKVRDIQAMLNRAGYSLKIDGDFGNATHLAVIDFQEKNMLVADGVVGHNTMTVLSKYNQGSSDEPGSIDIVNDPDFGKGVGVGVGGGVTLETVNDTVVDTMDKFGTTLPDLVTQGLSLVAVTITLVGIGWGLWKWLEKRKTVYGDEDLEWL